MRSVYIIGVIFASSQALAAPQDKPVVKAPPKALPTWELKADQGAGAVEFDALGNPSALKIKGTGGAPKGALRIEGKLVSGMLEFDLETLDTGIKLRNDHMKKKYLETEKYPKATLSFVNWALPDSVAGEEGKAENVPFVGILKLRGVEKKVSGTATIVRAGGKVDVKAALPIKTSEFGIETPSFAGITMGENVQVAVKLNAPLERRAAP